MKTSGCLFGIGVGPGDPELIPLKATRILGKMDIIFTAASTRNDYSLAVEIARPHIPAQIPIEKLNFPMSNDMNVKERAWQQHAARIAQVLETGQSAAFLTLGDPMTYSTYGYVLRHIQAGWPCLKVCTIPGITSYQAAAAAVNRPLVEGEESLLVLSGVHGGDRLRNSHQPENVVFMKAYRNMDGICQALEEVRMSNGSVAVANCSRENQRIYKDLEALSQQQPNYWTLVLAKQNGHHGPSKKS